MRLIRPTLGILFFTLIAIINMQAANMTKLEQMIAQANQRADQMLQKLNQEVAPDIPLEPQVSTTVGLSQTLNPTDDDIKRAQVFAAAQEKNKGF